MSHRILVVTADTLAAKMAGPAIRAWNIAQALAPEHDVRLVTTGQCTLAGAELDVRAVDDDELRALVEWCDVFVFQGWVLAGRPWIGATDKVIVCDLYDPMHLEQLEQGREHGRDGRKVAVSDAARVLNEQLRRGDFFVCASDKQRDFWLGQLAGVGRVNPMVYDEDDALRSLIDVVPFGLSVTPPVRTRAAVKGVLPGIGADDKLILWGGGIYNWFDPVTLIDAVGALAARHPEVRLLFMGLRHPNPEVAEMRMAVAARRRADGLGLTDKVVFFNEGWVDYDDRHNFLLDADLGVSTHFDHLETQFSFRTRILDYLWAGLPVVSTGGDALADLIERRGLGLVVPPTDVAALETALERLLFEVDLIEQCRANTAGAAAELTWPTVLEPLVAFCRHPRRAPDLLDPLQSHLISVAMVAPHPRLVARVRRRFGRAQQILRDDGVSAVLRRMLDPVRRAA
ncbi:MAG: glycosyltransferase family 4 protein, partial [Acidimicrobiales bacterium]